MDNISERRSSLSYTQDIHDNAIKASGPPVKKKFCGFFVKRHQQHDLKIEPMISERMLQMKQDEEEYAKTNPSESENSICTNTLLEGAISILDCGHLLHKKCLNNWMITHKPVTCPFCRKEPDNVWDFDSLDIAIKDQIFSCSNDGCLAIGDKESISKTSCPYPLAELDTTDMTKFLENNHEKLCMLIKNYFNKLGKKNNTVKYEASYQPIVNNEFTDNRRDSPGIHVSVLLSSDTQREFVYLGKDLNTKSTAEEALNTLYVDLNCDTIISSIMSAYNSTLFNPRTTSYIYNYDYSGCNSFIIRTHRQFKKVVGLSDFINIDTKEFNFDKFNEAVIRQHGEELLKELYSGSDNNLDVAIPKGVFSAASL